jgi:hypothetical protein
LQANWTGPTLPESLLSAIHPLPLAAHLRGVTVEGDTTAAAEVHSVSGAEKEMDVGQRRLRELLSKPMTAVHRAALQALEVRPLSS